MGVNGGEAESRVVRLVSFVAGLSALAAVATFSGSVVAQWSSQQPWWSVLVVLAAIVLPATQVVVAVLNSVRLMRLVALVLAATWVTALLSLEWGLRGGSLPEGSAAPWIIGVTPVPAIAAALALPAVAAWVCCVAIALLVAIDRMLSNPGDIVGVAVQDALASLLVQSILVALVLAVLSTARSLDRAADEARTEYARQARAEAQRLERLRTDAVVHDHVLTTLVTAGREPGSQDGDAAIALAREVAASARRALAAIDRTLRPEPRDTTAATTVAELVHELQGLTTELSPLADFTAEGIGRPVHGSPGAVPREAADALLGATAEALRNSVRHAGARVNRAVRFEAGEGSLRVLVLDDGDGFDPQAVESGRLGLRVSVAERMRSAGGASRIVSSPGSGSIVELVWPWHG
jgi:signal transduction histidine kinase